MRSPTTGIGSCKTEFHLPKKQYGAHIRSFYCYCLCTKSLVRLQQGSSFAVIVIYTSILPFKSFGVRMISSGWISFKWNSSSSSFGSIIFAREKGESPPRLSRQALLMWLIIRFTSSCVSLSKVVLPCGHILRMYSWFFSQCGFCHEAIGSQ